MDPNPLRDQLSQLHDELGRVNTTDPRSSRLLAEIMKDIKRLAHPAEPTTEVADESGAPLAAANPSLPDRLEQIAVQFEIEHPTLAASSRRLVDLLGKVGL